MGLDPNSLRFVLCAKQMGVDFSRTLMIGRQRLNLGASELHDALHELGFRPTELESADMHSGSGRFADDLLRYLGADEIDSLDHSAYQGATLVHDLNEPVAVSWRCSYSVVLDSGTLEHVFDVPTALRSCAEMVLPGGHYIVVVPANNFFGHGFYQFSPEFFFRVLSPSNQFEIMTCVVFTDDTVGQWYEVRDPDDVNARVTLCNGQPTYIAVVARKTGDGAVLAQAPQQSDYVKEWTGARRPDQLTAVGRAIPQRPPRAAPIRVPDRLKAPLRRRVAGVRRRIGHRSSRGLNSAHFSRVRPVDLAARTSLASGHERTTGPHAAGASSPATGQ